MFGSGCLCWRVFARTCALAVMAAAVIARRSPIFMFLLVIVVGLGLLNMDRILDLDIDAWDDKSLLPSRNATGSAAAVWAEMAEFGDVEEDGFDDFDESDFDDDFDDDFEEELDEDEFELDDDEFGDVELEEDLDEEELVDDFDEDEEESDDDDDEEADD